MSIFASRTQQTVDLPFDPPHTVTIQALSGRQLERARQAKQIAAQAYVAQMGGQAFRDQLAAIGDTELTKAAIAKAQADPLTGFDRDVVLERGIATWSYKDNVTPAAIADLTEEAADFLARAILDLTLPPRDEAATKNASGSSRVG